MISRVLWGLLVINLTLGAQDEALHVVVLEGEGAINNVRSARTKQPVVRVEDAANRGVPGAVVTFLLPASGAEGNLHGRVARSSLTLTTDDRGEAVARGLHANRLPGTFQIHVSASKGGRTASASINQTNVDPGSHSSSRTIAILGDRRRGRGRGSGGGIARRQIAERRTTRGAGDGRRARDAQLWRASVGQRIGRPTWTCACLSCPRIERGASRNGDERVQACDPPSPSRGFASRYACRFAGAGDGFMPAKTQHHDDDTTCGKSERRIFPNLGGHRREAALLVVHLGPGTACGPDTQQRGCD